MALNILTALHNTLNKIGNTAKLNADLNYKINNKVYQVYQDSKGNWYYKAKNNGSLNLISNKKDIELLNKYAKESNGTSSRLVTHNTTSEYTPPSGGVNNNVTPVTPELSDIKSRAANYKAGGGGYASTGGGKSAFSGGGSGGARTAEPEELIQDTIDLGGYGDPYQDLYDALKEDIDARNKKLDELKEQLAELTKPKTAREIAEELAIDYDEQNLLDMYNEDTNTYYDDMIKAQNETRDQYLRNNSQYANQLAKNYLDSYKYAAPTAVGKAAKGANVLATNLYTSQDNSANDTGMLQSVNALEEARKAELAMNPYTAKDYYTQMGTALANASATRNYSDVMQYQQKSNALAQIDAANRAAKVYNAQAAATKYSGLAGAQGTAASGSGNGSYIQQLYNLYYNTNGGNKVKTANALYSTLMGSGTK